MVFQSFILGILFSIGIFAVKSGMGLYYGVWSGSKRRIQYRGIVLFVITYFLAFALVALVVPNLDPLAHLNTIRTFIESGMVMHFALALVMLTWGVILIVKQKTAGSRTKAWLLLTLPCPVCLSVIFCSAACCVFFFPDHSTAVILLLYLAFMLISVSAMVVIHFYVNRNVLSLETFLGRCMILIAAYFFLSVIILPHFSDVEKVYRMACYHGESPYPCSHQIASITLIIGVFAAGYGITFKNIRSLA